MKSRRESLIILRKFILETLQLQEGSTTSTGSTSATTPTSPGTKIPKELETEKDPDQEKQAAQKNSFVGKALEKAKTLAKKPPMGQEINKIVKGPGQPKNKIANAAGMFGSLIAGELPNIDKINPQQVSQEFKKKARELEDELTALQQAHAQQADLEKKETSSNPLISKK